MTIGIWVVPPVDGVMLKSVMALVPSDGTVHETVLWVLYGIAVTVAGTAGGTAGSSNTVSESPEGTARSPSPSARLENAPGTIAVPTFVLQSSCPVTAETP